MSFAEEFGEQGFAINRESTTEIIGRFHRTLMDRRDIDWEGLDPDNYDEQTREQARREWASRAVAEYYSTSQFSQLSHRLCALGAPVELIGASTRLSTDECRHAELCAMVADRLGGRQGYDVGDEQLSMFDDADDLWLAVYQSILQLCCFGETISVPILEAMHVVSNDPVIEEVAGIIAADEGYHMNFGWEALEWMTPKLDDEQRRAVRESLPRLVGSFEQVCRGGPEVLQQLAGEDLVVEEDDEPNLGTLTDLQYAGIFYHCIEEDVLPRLQALGFDSRAIWEERLVHADDESAVEAH